MIKQRLGNYQNAIIYFDSAMVKAPTWVLPPANIMDGYKRIRWLEKADSMGRVILSMDSNYYKVYRSLGDIFELKNQMEEAKEMYLKSLAINPDFIDVNDHMARIYLDEGKNNLARPYIEKTIALDSTFFNGYYHMALYYLRSSKRDSAIIYFEKAIPFDTSFLEAYINLSYQYMYNNKFTKSKETLDRLNNLYPNHFEYYFGMACWNALQGNINAGLEELKKAIQNGLSYDRIKDDTDIDALRGTEGFVELINEYFPEE